MSDPLPVEIGKVPVIPGMSITTVKLIEFLKPKSPEHNRTGEILTDGQLSEACGKVTGVEGDGYSSLQSAIRHVLRNYGILWERVRSGGCIKCLTDPESIASASRDNRHVFKMAGRGLAKLKPIDPAKVDPDARTKMFTTLAQLGAVRQFASPTTKKNLEVHPITTLEEVKRRQAKMLEAFK